jgi:hypothetical protein
MSLQKISANTRLGCVETLSWFAAPRYNFFIDTLTPLTLVDVVVLRHARQVEASEVMAKTTACVTASVHETINAYYPQPTTSDRLWRSPIATDSNFGLEERKCRGKEI